LSINQYELDSALQREVGENLKEISQVIERYAAPREDKKKSYQEELKDIAKRLERLDAKAEVAMSCLESIANSLEDIAAAFANKEKT